MADTFLLYISAASDLEHERDILGRAVTEVPVTLAWRIVQTPLHGDPPDMQAVAQADLYLLLLGGDIRAPVGLEWQVARRAGRTPVLFLKQGAPRTPAACPGPPRRASSAAPSPGSRRRRAPRRRGPGRRRRAREAAGSPSRRSSPA